MQHNLGDPVCYVISCNILDDGRCRLDAVWEELLSGTRSYVGTCMHRLIFGTSWFQLVLHQTQSLFRSVLLLCKLQLHVQGSSRIYYFVPACTV